VHARAKTTCDYTKVLSRRLLRPQSDMATSDVALLLCQQSVFRPPLPPSQSNAEGFPCGSAHTYQAYHAAARSVHHGSCVGAKQPTESNKQSETKQHRHLCAQHIHAAKARDAKHSIPLAHLACTTTRVLTNQRTRGERMCVCVCVCVCVCLCVCITMTASRLPSLQKNHHTYLQASHSHHRRRRHRFREWVVLV
jgi:hypothetical protein